MSRIEPLDGDLDNEDYLQLLRNSERSGTPDRRMIRVLGRSEIGAKSLLMFQAAATEGLLPIRLKELVRIRMSVLEECGYCSSIRSTLAMDEGLTEEIVLEMVDLDSAPSLSEAEKAALRFADLYRANAIDSDEVFDALGRHFSDEEIIELGVLCGLLDGGGKFARALQVVTWDQACDVRPSLLALQDQAAAVVPT